MTEWNLHAESHDFVCILMAGKPILVSSLIKGLKKSSEIPSRENGVKPSVNRLLVLCLVCSVSWKSIPMQACFRPVDMPEAQAGTPCESHLSFCALCTTGHCLLNLGNGDWCQLCLITCLPLQNPKYCRLRFGFPELQFQYTACLWFHFWISKHRLLPLKVWSISAFRSQRSWLRKYFFSEPSFVLKRVGILWRLKYIDFNRALRDVRFGQQCTFLMEATLGSLKRPKLFLVSCFYYCNVTYIVLWYIVHVTKTTEHARSW